MRLKAENVFKPGAYPEYTYVSRNYENTGISYELRLKQALRTAGCLTSLIGPSKMGKTIDVYKRQFVHTGMETDGMETIFPVEVSFGRKHLTENHRIFIVVW